MAGWVVFTLTMVTVVCYLLGCGVQEQKIRDRQEAQRERKRIRRQLHAEDREWFAMVDARVDTTSSWSRDPSKDISIPLL